MTFDEGVAVLRQWMGRQVVLVIWSPTSDGAAPPRPLAGTLRHRDMWPEAPAAEDPQARGEVEFFDVMRPHRMPHLTGPEGSTVALYRHVVTSCEWIPREENRALAFGMDSLTAAFWL